MNAASAGEILTALGAGQQASAQHISSHHNVVISSQSRLEGLTDHPEHGHKASHCRLLGSRNIHSCQLLFCERAAALCNGTSVVEHKQLMS